jgi:hypothetical protein
MNEPETDSADDYAGVVERICSEAAGEFRRCIADPSEQRSVACRYLRNGSKADISHSELIDFLAVSTPSVLDRAGYSDEQAQSIMDMLATITDEEFATMKSPNTIASHEPPPPASSAIAPVNRTRDSLPAPGSSGGR